MKAHKFIFLIAAVGIAQSAFALESIPIPKVGHCPNEYQTQGDFCVPISERARFVLHRDSEIQGCPSGYSVNGNYCVVNYGNIQRAIPKEGMNCPNGWSISGQFCLENR